MTELAVIDQVTFREAMATFPSGVTIVTARDADGTPWGFTATAFCALSAQPPLVLVCLAKTAQCHPAFGDCDEFVVHVITDTHVELAQLFATRGADKFAGDAFDVNGHGLPVLPNTAARFECAVHERLDGGDHTILIGRVSAVETGDGTPTVYFRRAFHRLPVAHAEAS